MLKVFYLFFIVFSCSLVYAQTNYDWDLLPNSPNANSRFNDAYFTSEENGIVVNGKGQIYKTTNGGSSWSLKFEKNTAHFRSVGFIDSLNGFAGNVGLGEFGATDPTFLYETSDGGETWLPVSGISLSAGSGICGMNVVNDSVVVAVGRVRGPAVFIKTVNGGVTWLSKSMGSYAAGLIDVHFFNPDSGYAVGLTSITHSQSSGIVLFTSDGGASWEERYRTSRTGEWIWKINFPSRNVGYGSLQRNIGSPVNIVKTTDGGVTWFEKQFSADPYFVQGIGFANDTLGWIGGNSTEPTFETTDGGETWHEYPFGSRVNRFRMLNDTVGYAVGDRVYKFTAESSITFIAENSDIIPNEFSLEQNYPNPFNPVTSIKYKIAEAGLVRLKVYDLLGKEIAVLVDENKSPGSYEVKFDASELISGVYFYRLQTGKFSEVKKLMLLR